MIFSVQTKHLYQTLTELKQMLIEDDAPIRTLSIFNNNGRWQSHNISIWFGAGYCSTNIYYLKVYDNANPNSNNPIIIDTFANSGNGTWSTRKWIQLGRK